MTTYIDQETAAAMTAACELLSDMLAALHQTVNQFDTLYRLGVITEQQCADCTRFALAAIAQASAAGVRS